MNKWEMMSDCNIIHYDKVDNARKNMLSNEMFNNLSEFYRVLGDETRTKILFILDQNEMCVCDIANTLGMTKSAISHQLAMLKRMNIVKYRKAGKEVYYMLDDEHVKEVFEIGLMHIKHLNGGCKDGN